MFLFFFSSRRRHTRSKRDWSSDVCSSDLPPRAGGGVKFPAHIVQYQGEPEFFELRVSDVKVNAPVDLTQPPARGGRGGGRGAAPGGAPAEIGRASCRDRV